MTKNLKGILGIWSISGAVNMQLFTIDSFVNFRKDGYIKNTFYNIIIPEAVYDEVFTRGFDKVSVPDFLTMEKISDKNLVESLEMQIGYGESEVIALALERKITRVLMDDKQARKIAESLGLKVMGTLGVLILAKEKQLIAEMKPLVLELIEKISFRIDKKVLNKALKSVNEGDL